MVDLDKAKLLNVVKLRDGTTKLCVGIATDKKSILVLTDYGKHDPGCPCTKIDSYTSVLGCYYINTIQLPDIKEISDLSKYDITYQGYPAFIVSTCFYVQDDHGRTIESLKKEGVAVPEAIDPKIRFRSYGISSIEAKDLVFKLKPQKYKEAMYRIGIRQLSKHTRNILAAQLCKESFKHSSQAIGELLDSELGRGLITGLLGASLTKLSHQHPQLEKCAEEARIESLMYGFESLLSLSTGLTKNTASEQLTIEQNIEVESIEEEDDIFGQSKQITC
jgi:hypothetical protein